MERSRVARPLRVVLLGDGLWASASLDRLVAEGHVVAGVVVRTQPSDDTLERAASSQGVPVYQPQRVNAAEFVGVLGRLAPDLLLSVAYNQILGAEIRNAAPLGAINVHAGKLPAYRGRNVINWALINGEREIGLTVHYMDDGIDTGDVLLQRTLPIGWTDTYGDVLRRVQLAVPDLVAAALRMFAPDLRPPGRPQPQIGSYCPGRAPGDEWLDWNGTSASLYHKIRALSDPGPGARTLLGDAAVVVWRAAYDPAWPGYLATPGAIVGRTQAGVLVKTGDSVLLVTEVQLAGGQREIPRWPFGARLGLDTVGTLHALLQRIAALEQELGRGLPS